MLSMTCIGHCIQFRLVLTISSVLGLQLLLAMLAHGLAINIAARSGRPLEVFTGV